MGEVFKANCARPESIVNVCPPLLSDYSIVLHTSCFLDFIGLCARRSKAVGSEVFADVGRVGSVVACLTIAAQSMLASQP